MYQIKTVENILDRPSISYNTHNNRYYIFIVYYLIYNVFNILSRKKFIVYRGLVTNKNA